MDATEARERIKKAVKRDGGVMRVAERAGVHFTQVYAFMRGGSLTPANAGKLRAAVRGVPAYVWADAFAPAPPSTPEAP